MPGQKVICRNQYRESISVKDLSDWIKLQSDPSLINKYSKLSRKYMSGNFQAYDKRSDRDKKVD